MDALVDASTTKFAKTEEIRNTEKNGCPVGEETPRSLLKGFKVPIKIIKSRV